VHQLVKNFDNIKMHGTTVKKNSCSLLLQYSYMFRSTTEPSSGCQINYSFKKLNMLSQNAHFFIYVT